MPSGMKEVGSMSQQQKRDIWFEHVRRAQRAGGSLAAYARSIQVAPRVMY